MIAIEKQLIEIYTTAQNQLFETIAKKAAVGSPATFQRSMLKEVTAILDNLSIESELWAVENIEPMYLDGIRQARENTKARYKVSDEYLESIGKISSKAFSVINQKAIEAMLTENIASLSIANASLAKNIRDTIATKIATGETVKQTSKRITEQIYGSGIVNKDGIAKGKISIKCKDGKVRNYEPSKYAETVARSATQETTNTALDNERKRVGSDIIGMTSHFPTCPVCAPLQGRWYSAEPDNKEYPYIRGSNGAWKSGYNLVHPNCRHRFFIVITALEDVETIKEMKNFSNRSFKLSAEDEKQLANYWADQKYKSEQWRDLQQYNRYVSRLGADNVPRSFSAFRRMKASNNDNWLQLQEDYRDAGLDIKKIINK